MSFSIDNLIDDCLLLIFYRLSLGDRIKSRLTCNRWATLMPFDDIDSFDVNILPFAPKQFFPAQPRSILDTHIDNIRRSSILRAFDCILPRIGANLKSMSLGTTIGPGAILLLNNYHFDLIILHCPQLNKLEIGIDANLSHMDFDKLAIQLSKMPSLQTLTVCDYSLNDRQRVLLATAFGNQTWPYLTDFTANYICRRVIVAPQLKNLDLPYVTNFILSNWCEAHPNLSSLKLTGMDERLRNCSPIANLKHLTNLSMEYYQLNDEELSLICFSCPKLISVNFNLARVNRFDYLLRLKSLTVLRLSVGEHFNESDLVAIARRGNLKSFRFSDNRRQTTAFPLIPLLTDFGLTNLVNFNPNLEVFKLLVWFISEESILTVLGVCKQLKTLALYNTALSSDMFAVLGGCENLSKFKMDSGVETTISADHYRSLLNARRQNGLRHRLKVVVEDGQVWQQTEEKTFLKEELKKVNIFVSYWF